jgi:hypothetical protein
MQHNDKRRRLLPAMALITFSALCFFAARDVVPDPDPGMTRHAFTLLFGATFASVFGGVASALAAIGILLLPQSE